MESLAAWPAAGDKSMDERTTDEVEELNSIRPAEEDANGISKHESAFLADMRENSDEGNAVKRLHDERYAYLIERIAQLEISIEKGDNQRAVFDRDYSESNEEQLAALDNKIAALEKSVWDQDIDLAHVRLELNMLKIKDENEAEKYELELIKGSDRIRRLELELKALRDTLQSTRVIHEYADALRDVRARSNSSVESSYVIRLEAQMCNALHRMGIMGNQIDVMKQFGQENSSVLKKDANRLIEEAGERELAFLNELSRIHGDMIEMEQRYKKKLGEQEAEIERLKQDINEGESFYHDMEETERPVVQMV